MTEQDFFKLIAEEEKIRIEQVQATIALLDDENTVPFIARYRKEVTGGLDENQIIAIQDRVRYLRTLEERKQTVLKSIEEQGKLTDDLRAQIEAAVKLQEVEDLYLPYKPKKRTRATIAKEKGLEPLAQQMWAQQENSGNLEEIAAAFIDAEKGVNTAEEALAGGRDIIAEWVSDDAEVRKLVREKTWDAGMLRSEAKDEKNVDVYEMYKDYREPLKKVVPHRTLAINRGETEGFLKVLVEAPVPELLMDLEHKFITNPKSIYREQLQLAIKDSYERLVSPAIERELRNQLTEVADEHAINIFATNLRNLLLQPPTKGHIIMGIDPGLRTGCKVAVIDETGKYLEGDTIFPHEPKNRWDYSKDQLKALIQKYKVNVIAIGNGTASRETEQLAAELIQQMEAEAQQNGAALDLKYAIVSEAGASVYSASKLAGEEFPDLEASQRGNISIAR
ncbi:MAG: Tex-like N-terminal domain-containing protein, partial [bacterium]